MSACVSQRLQNVENRTSSQVRSACRKTSIVIQKWGLGRSPKAGRRDASPRIHPRHGCRACMHKGFARCKANQAYTAFHGERGQGDRDNKSEVYFKNSLSLQTKRPHLITGAVLLILNLTASQDYRQAD